MLPHTESGEAGRLDVLGLGLLSTGATAVVYGLSQLGTNASLTAPSVVWPILVGLVLTGAFCWHALRVERPLLDIRLYANRVFAAASLTTFGLGAALFGAMILVPLLLPGGAPREPDRDRPARRRRRAWACSWRCRSPVA